MKNIENKYPKCFICNGENKFFMKSYDYLSSCTKDEFDLIKCNKCGLEMIYPMLQYNDLKKYYPQSIYQSSIEIDKNDTITYKIYKKLIIKIIERRTTQTHKLLRFLTRNLLLQIPNNTYKNKKYLDIGCNNSKYFSFLEKKGRECYGFEIGEPNHLGNIKFDYSLENVEYKTKFDYIIMNHVMEHVNKPETYLKKIHTLLADDGEFVLSFPNTDSISARLFKKYRLNRDTPRHVINYNVKNFSMLVEKTGFKIKKIEYMGFGGFIYSIKLLLKEKYNISSNWLFNGNILTIPFYAIDLFFMLIKKNDCVKFILGKR